MDELENDIGFVDGRVGRCEQIRRNRDRAYACSRIERQGLAYSVAWGIMTFAAVGLAYEDFKRGDFSWGFYLKAAVAGLAPFMFYRQGRKMVQPERFVEFNQKTGRYDY